MLPVRRRIPVLLLALVLTAGACTDPGELGGPGVGGTVAARIGDDAVTNADLQDEVEAWASNPEFLATLGVGDLGRPGARSTALVTFVLSHRVLTEQARQLAAQVGFTPDPAQIQTILDSVAANFVGPDGSSLLDGYSEEFLQRLGEDLALQDNLGRLDPSQVSVPAVQVSPRYGDAQVVQGGIVQVVPPSGPQPAPLLSAEG